jgi:hypothetical protein
VLAGPRDRGSCLCFGRRQLWLMDRVLQSLLVLDRYWWVREALEEEPEEGGNGRMAVELVNLFDQATGSGRNMAIVLAPSAQ